MHPQGLARVQRALLVGNERLEAVALVMTLGDLVRDSRDEFLMNTLMMVFGGFLKMGDPQVTIGFNTQLVTLG